MNKILVNHKNMALLVVPLMLMFSGILSINSFSLAAEDSYSENSTSQTHYDYLVNYKQKQDRELTNFKTGINDNVTDLKKDIAAPSSEVKSGKAKYADEKRSAALGRLYGSKGKLELDEGIAAVTDTKPLEMLTVIKQPPILPPTRLLPTVPPVITRPEPPPIQPPIIKPCRQTAYGCLY
jgi:hypothetical protein